MHTITVEVRGGLVVDVTNLPPDTEVRVIDYDNDRTGQTADIYRAPHVTPHVTPQVTPQAT